MKLSLPRLCRKLAVAVLLAAVFFVGHAHAQAVPCVGPVQGNCVPVIISQSTAGTAGFPAGATPITVNASGTTLAVNATLAAAVGKFTYICGYMISVNATAATFGAGAIANVVTANMGMNVPVFAAPAVAITQQVFTPCIPSIATNTAITVVSPAAGAVGNNQVYAWGYQL